MLALAAVPIAVLAQCAPQCAPMPPRPPTTTSPVGISVRHTDITTAVPLLGRVAAITPNGRHVTVTNYEAASSFDLLERTSMALRPNGILSRDGATVAVILDTTTAGRVAVATGAVEARVPLPAGLTAADLRGAAGDNTVVVLTANDRSGSTSALRIDLTTGFVGQFQHPSSLIGYSAAPIISDDGRVSVYSTRVTEPGCERCEALVISQVGVAPDSYITTTSAGSLSSASHNPLDISSDGRFILFSSTADDLPGAIRGVPGMFVFDSTTSIATRLPPASSGVSAAISDDGNRIVYTVTEPSPWNGIPASVSFPRLYDRTTGTTTTLAIANTYEHSLLQGSPVTMNAAGTRVAFTEIGPGVSPNLPIPPRGGRIIVADLTG